MNTLLFFLPVASMLLMLFLVLLVAFISTDNQEIEYTLVHAGVPSCPHKNLFSRKPEIDPHKTTWKRVYLDNKIYRPQSDRMLIRIYDSCAQKQNILEGDFYLAKKFSDFPDDLDHLKKDDWVIVKAKNKNAKMWRFRRIEKVESVDSQRLFYLQADDHGVSHSPRSEHEMIGKVI